MVASADGSEVRRLAELEKPDQVVLNGPAWSADGKTIVVAARSLRDGPHFLVVGIDVATGAATRLEGRWTGILDLDWVPGTDSFVLAATEVGLSSPQLWQIRYPTGERRRLTYDLNGYTSLSISQDASSLAAVQTEAVSNLWVSSATDPASGVQITRGRGRADGQGGLDWTPDGRIVFVSGASGEPQIWIADADGRNAQQLTAAEQEPVFGLSVTPDGRHVIFQRMAARHMRIWRMNMDGSEQRWITDGSLDQGPVAAPGGLVYFLRVVPGGTRAFRVSIDGGAPVQVSEDPFRPIDVSADGAQLLGVLWNATAQRSSLAIMSATGGAPRLLDAPSFNGSFTADGKGVIYPAVERGAVRVDQLDLASGKVATFGSVRDFVFHGALSPDGKRLVLSRGGVISDVVLVTMKHGADE
jgi:Tol biopolymer transport system component